MACPQGLPKMVCVWFLGPDDKVLGLNEWIANPLGHRALCTRRKANKGVWLLSRKIKLLLTILKKFPNKSLHMSKVRV